MHIYRREGQLVQISLAAIARMRDTWVTRNDKMRVKIYRNMKEKS